MSKKPPDGGAGKALAAPNLNPVTPMVDAHQHFWTYGTYQTSWMEKAP